MSVDNRTAYEWDVFLSARKAEKGVETDLVRTVYTLLCRKSLRVFWESTCLSPKDARNPKIRERKYLHAAVNSAIAVVFVSRRSFTSRDFDVKRYVWSSSPDELLLEWDMLLELYDRGRVMGIMPCLIGDVTSPGVSIAQDRVMTRLGIQSLDEAPLVKRIREIFDFTDRDKSGFIDRQELLLAFKQFGLDLSETEIHLMMEEADGDEDAGIDVFEFEDMIKFLLETKCGISFDQGNTAAQKKQSAMVDKLHKAAEATHATETSARYFSNFFESGCLPELPPVILSQSKRILTTWMRQMNIEITPVLWRDKHLRAVPGLDGPGRTIRNTLSCILGFESYLAQGNVADSPDLVAAAIMRKWCSCVAVPPLRWTEGVKARQVTCFETGKPAQYIDPITLMPIRDLLIFHQTRQRFYLDERKCHESILLENHGSRLVYSGQGGASVLLGPTISAIGISYVEILLQVLGARPYMFLGVCDGTHDIDGGWTAASDPNTYLFNCFNGTKLHNLHAEEYCDTRVRQGDRVGLFVDGDNGSLEIFINDRPQGILATGLMRPLYYVIDVGWPGQSVEIIPRNHWQALGQNLMRFFEGLDAEQRDVRILQLFKEYDTDGSGKISLEEMRDALQRMHVYVADREITELMEDVDENKSGVLPRLTHSSFTSYLHRHVQMSVMIQTELMEEVDENNAVCHESFTAPLRRNYILRT